MEEYTLKCSECGKQFLVQVTTMNVQGGIDREKIECLYSYANNGYRMTSGFVYTYKMGCREDK